VGRDTVLCIASRYGADGSGFEPRWGERNFPHLSSPALGSTQTLAQWVLGLSPGVKRPWLTTHPHLAARLKEE